MYIGNGTGCMHRKKSAISSLEDHSPVLRHYISIKTLVKVQVHLGDIKHGITKVYNKLIYKSN